MDGRCRFEEGKGGRNKETVSRMEKDAIVRAGSPGGEK